MNTPVLDSTQKGNGFVPLPTPERIELCPRCRVHIKHVDSRVQRYYQCGESVAGVVYVREDLSKGLLAAARDVLIAIYNEGGIASWAHQVTALDEAVARLAPGEARPSPPRGGEKGK